MCGRFVFDISEQELTELIPIKHPVPQLPLTYNASPGMMLPVIRKNHKIEAVLMRWGLIPHWARDPKIGYRMINARSETLEDKPAFRSLLLAKRCIIPARGFYEWKIDGKEKIPYYVHFQSNTPMYFAGLYDVWKDVEGQPLSTFTIITTTPNGKLSSIHDRMPVILDKDNIIQWISEQTKEEELASYLKPYSETYLEVYPVGKEVNNPDNNNSSLVTEK